MLRNIEENQAIEALVSDALGSALPKTYAYADDVNAVITNTQTGLQEIFKEYGRLTRASGLELNADKTEIMHLNSRNQNPNDVMQLGFDVSYQGKLYRIQTSERIKVNGVYLQQNVSQMKDANVESALKKMDNILKKWTARHLTTLEKILIAKTFAILQSTSYNCLIST